MVPLNRVGSVYAWRIRADTGDNGPATSAQLYYPQGVAVDSAGNLYIADTYNARIRKVSNGVITTVAGNGASLGDNGPATGALFSEPIRVLHRRRRSSVNRSPRPAGGYA